MPILSVYQYEVYEVGQERFNSERLQLSVKLDGGFVWGYISANEIFCFQCQALYSAIDSCFILFNGLDNLNLKEQDILAV